MADEKTGSNETVTHETGFERYAPKNRRVDRMITGGIVTEIHNLVRRGVTQGPIDRSEIEPTGDPAKDNANMFIGRVFGETVEEIDQAIRELHSIRTMLRDEGDRVSREIVNYVGLNHSAKTAMRVIGDSLKQWKGHTTTGS